MGCLLRLCVLAGAVGGAGASGVTATRIFGLFPKESSIQDFWGPVREAFEETFYEYEASYQAESDAEVSDIVDEILAAVGDTPEAALVIGPVRHGEDHYARLLEAGAGAFFLAEGIDTEAYGLRNDTMLSWMFNPDTTTAAESVAKEICRTTTWGTHHKVLKLYGTAYADNRVDANVAYLEEYCNAQVEVIAAERALFKEDLAEELTFATLVKDSSVTTILAANDRMIKGALAAIDRALSPAKAAKLILGGFDWTEDWLLTEGKTVASGDQYMSTPDMGVWQTVINVIDTIHGYNLSTTADLQAFYRTTSTQFETESSCQFSDAEGNVIESLMRSYSADVRAKPADDNLAPTVVSVGMHDAAIESIDTAGGGFAATSWVALEWVDSRLIFDENIFNGPLRIPPTEIWTPDVYLSNLVTPAGLQTVKELPATIQSDGTVRVVFQSVGDYVCDMKIWPYPYDSHTCTFDVSVSAPTSDVVLQGTLGYSIKEGPEGFEDPEATDIIHLVASAEITGFASEQVSFEIEFERNPNYVVFTYILVGWALNMLGFLVFWIPVEGTNIDRSGLAITTILAAQFMMYDAKVTKESTWLDSYFSLMLVFQFFSFALTVHSARMNRYYVSHGGEDEFLKRVYAYQAQIKRKSTFHAVSFFTFNLLYGGLEAFWIHRWARRYLVPSFFIVQIGICFLPNWGKADISGSQFTGAAAPLFQVNLVFLLFYTAILILGWYLGFEKDQKMQTLQEDRKEEIAQVWQYKGISMAFAANIKSRAVQTDSTRKANAFHIWKQAAKEIGMAKTFTSNPKASARARAEPEKYAQAVDETDNTFVEAASIAFCSSGREAE